MSGGSTSNINDAREEDKKYSIDSNTIYKLYNKSKKN